MKRYLYLPFIFVAFVGCRETTPATSALPEVDELLKLMNERLDLMPEVANAKVYLGLPVDDAKREEALLQAAEVDANKNGLEAKFVREFFTAQFDAAKMVQEREMKTAPRPDPSDEGMKLAGDRFNEARTKINGINVKMIGVLARLKDIPAEERRKAFADRAGELLKGQEQDVREKTLKPLLEW